MVVVDAPIMLGRGAALEEPPDKDLFVVFAVKLELLCAWEE